MLELGDKASLTGHASWAPTQPERGARSQNELRLRAHARLREAGVFA